MRNCECVFVCMQGHFFCFQLFYKNHVFNTLLNFTIYLTFVCLRTLYSSIDQGLISVKKNEKLTCT